MFSFSTRKGGKWKKYKGEREGVEELAEEIGKEKKKKKLSMCYTLVV